MIEVELKYRADDVQSVRNRVQELRGERRELIEQVDTYFAHPVRDFAKSDEALRIRVVGDKACVTYKGPLLDEATKSRDETEIWFVGGTADGERFSHVLDKLGFRPVHTVRKLRELWSINYQDHDVEIAFDNVAQLGEFIELETAASADGFDEAKAMLLSLASRLKLQQSERRSYLSLLLENQ